jgi:(p)ppGpp synthase/HD superfamily hydrolase
LIVNTDNRDIDAQPADAPIRGAAVQRARTRAAQAHEGQLDKAGRPYIEHPERVVGHLVNPTTDEVVVAWLHDAVEDTEVTLQEVEREFGPTAAAAVDAITRRPDEACSGHYYARVKANPIALKVKSADLADNTDPARLALLAPDERARLELKYAHARQELGIH